MIRHIVMWKLKDDAEGSPKAENAKKMKDMLEALPDKISNILELQVGINENGGDYDAVLVTTFASYEDLRTYDEHPAHQQVRAFVRGVAAGRAAVDYTIEI